MVDRSELGERANCVDDLHYLGLVRRGDVDIFDRSANNADEVVMVSADPFGEFIAGEPLGAEMGDDYTRLLQDR